MLEYEELIYRIRGCVFEVFREMGADFLEKVYEKALTLELKKQGLDVNTQPPIKVSYKNVVVGEYIVDLLVENAVSLELKAVNKIRPEHEAQLLNYLKATGI